ncbi:MAG TPA: putative sugar nucleotidyl transferase [Tepidisphaeraceae bacterium]|nr:putative sugar nucleotidyl transferase [Tepidisphaeraceae bacterium]
MHVVIFEGMRWDTFAPLALSRPTFTLPCGMGTLLDKQIELLSPTRLSLWVRPELADFCRKQVVPQLKVPTTVNQPLDDEPALLTTGRTLHLAKFEVPQAPAVVLEQGDLVRFAYVKNMAGLSPADVMSRSDRWLKLMDLPHTMPQARYVDYVWDLISWNEEALVSDFVRYKGCSQPAPSGPWHLIHEESICLADGAKLAPGCVLDASRGPIVIDKGATIGANSVIEGPAYIGQYTTVLPLSFIRPGTSIGSVCRVAGEISNSIVSSYTNKAHYGYLGDSFVGSWVNLGAGTTTSNLKNTYGEVKIKIGSKEYKTGRRNLGSIIGDHTKTAIGTRLNTGSYVGYCCLLAGSGLTPKFMPSFSFWTQKGTEKYDMAKASEVATKVFGRRDKQWTSDDQAMMNYVAETAATVEK